MLSSKNQKCELARFVFITKQWNNVLNDHFSHKIFVLDATVNIQQTQHQFHNTLTCRLLGFPSERTVYHIWISNPQHSPSASWQLLTKRSKLFVYFYLIWNTNTLVVSMLFPCRVSFFSVGILLNLSTSLILSIELPWRYKICKSGNWHMTCLAQKFSK